ncbi:hypothetical protein D9M71_450150 [compost metagenome]
MMETTAVRTFFGAYSFISATTFGINPPHPRPAKKRHTPNSVGVLASPLTRVAQLNSRQHTAIPFLRPTWSARVPKHTAPNIMPKSA